VSDIQPPASLSGLASIGAVVRGLADDAPVNEAPKPAVKLAKAEAKPTPKKAVATKAVVEAEAKAPARYWVQIASAPDARAAAEYKRLKGKSPQLLGDTTGWKTANRVLVGPFKNRGEAQALVNKLAKADIAAVQWTSPEGQEIVKLAAK
jgi:cell division protein FtsN